MKRSSAVLAAAALIVGLSTAAPLVSTSAPTPVEHKLSIVQLGDSYSAGNGAGSYFGPQHCFRSSLNWGQEFTSWINTLGIAATYDNRACSGGVIANVFEARQFEAQSRKGIFADSAEDALAKLQAGDACGVAGQDDVLSVDYNVQAGGALLRPYSYACQLTLRPQADFVGPQTDVVLMTMGGNDVRFATVVADCFSPYVPFKNPGASPAACRAAVESAQEDLPATLAAVEATIDKLLGEKMTGRDTSQVVLMGYPLLATDAPYVLEKDGVRYDAATSVRALGTSATQLQQDLVDRLNEKWGGRVTYIDGVAEAFAGHEPDPRLGTGNPYRWLNEFAETEGDVRADGTTGASTSLVAENFWHPNRIGHREYAKLVQLTGVSENAPLIGGASADIDIVFTIDTTGSMGDDIAAVRANVTQIADTVQERAGTVRYALVTYQDHPTDGGGPDDYPARVDLDFTGDVAALKAAVDAIELGYGGDTAESVYSGINAGLDLDWRPGVRKTMLVLGDAAPKSPEPVTGLTWQQLAAKAYAIDPVQIYLVDTWGAGSADMLALIEETGGEAFRASSGEVADSFIAAITDVLDKPFAWLQGPYVAKVGSTVTLDARGSHAIGAQIAQYEWDFDGDGTWDATTEEPLIDHTYAELITGFVGVRVTDTNGESSVGSTRLAITRDGDEVPDEFDNCVDVANPNQQDLDMNGVGDDCQDFSGLTFSLPEGVTVVEDEPTPTPTPSPTPTATPAPTPSASPSARPTSRPTTKPTSRPTSKPRPGLPRTGVDAFA